MSVIAIIPCRKGSKRFPGKNLAPLNGQPLFLHTLLPALASDVLDRVIVSTDDPEIARLATEHGCPTPVLRPVALAQDDTSTANVVSHELAQQDVDFEITVLLQATSPLRPADLPETAVQLLRSNSEIDAVVGVRKLHVTAGDLYTAAGSATGEYGWLNPLAVGDHAVDVFVPNGALYAIRSDCFLESRSFVPPKSAPIPMSDAHSTDIDTKEDFELAEALLRYQD